MYNGIQHSLVRIMDDHLPKNLRGNAQVTMTFMSSVLSFLSCLLTSVLHCSHTLTFTLLVSFFVHPHRLFYLVSGLYCFNALVL